MRAATIAHPVASGIEQPHYLPFVDGLRAISILAVVGCHVGLPGFSGGYIGVDVFFVISGFLIINQIKNGLESGRFTFMSFYARRILRIHPPFLIMLLTVYLFALFILPTPDIYFDFVQSAVLSPLMLINIFFYMHQGYFDISAHDKPLLHTWTLSVEEQFYAVIPLLLVMMFRLGRRRFGVLALAAAIIAAALSLAGAIDKTPLSGPNPAFYFTHWRMWEFIAGGLIGGPLVARFARLPRPIVEMTGAAGLTLIVVAIALFNAVTPYPSWRAVLPVAGATLIILSGLSQPNITAVRFLALRGMVGIGLVSYGWYLWHWPILSFLRISRLGEASLLGDFLGAGVLGFALACVSYRFVELPIRRWRRSSGGIQRPAHILAGGVTAGVTAAIVGGLISFGGYLWITSYVETVYGIEGKGPLDNGCRLIAASTIPGHCLEGNPAMLLGDSHADTMFGGLARVLDGEGLRLIYVGRGGCDPLHFAPKQRKEHRQHNCSNLLGPFEQLMARQPPIGAVIITPSWAPEDQAQDSWVNMLSQFNPSQTRVLVIAPVPGFKHSSLDCVVLSDRYVDNRDRCVRPRSEVEADRAPWVDALKAAAFRAANVRYIDPIDLFCDKQVCRPFEGNRVFYSDGSHVVTQGIDRITEHFVSDFRWLAGEK